MTNQQGAPEALYASAMEFAAEKASISYVQRKCRCSWNDAEQMLERMVREGIIATYNGRKSAALVEAQQPATHVQDQAFEKHKAQATCEVCGDKLTDHEDESSTECRWCATGWKPSGGDDGHAACPPNAEITGG